MSLAVAIDQLRVNTLRTALSMLGVVIGVAALVAVLALGDGFEKELRRMADSDGRLQSIGVSTRTSDAIEGQRVLRDGYSRFGMSDAQKLRDALTAAGFEATKMRLSVMGLARVERNAWAQGAKLRGVSVAATTLPEDTAVLNRVVAGRFFSAAEANEGTAVAVVSDSLAKIIAGSPAAAVGKTLYLEQDSALIVGVMSTEAAPNRSMLIATVPLLNSERFLAPTATPSVPAFMLKAARVEDVIPVKKATESWLQARFGEKWADSAQVQSYEREAEQGAQAILMFKLFMGAITGISLLVGGIGIMNVLLTSVTERTREIGIRRAVGAHKRHIMRQFLAESVVISSFGALLGTALGMLGAIAATAAMRRVTVGTIHPGFSVSTVVVVVVAALTVGLLFGTYPALRASRLSPLDALRHE